MRRANNTKNGASISQMKNKDIKWTRKLSAMAFGITMGVLWYLDFEFVVIGLLASFIVLIGDRQMKQMKLLDYE